MLHEKDKIIIRNIKKEKAFEDEEGNDIPLSQVALEIDEDAKEIIVAEILAEKEAIEEEREDNGFNDRCKAQRKQFEGTLVAEAYDDMLFDMQSGITKDRCRAVRNRVYRTITNTDPLFSISERPATAKIPGIEDITQAQEDYIDYAVDERMKFKRDLKRVILEATIVPVGFLKFSLDILVENKRKREKYKSDPTWTIVVESAIDPTTRGPLVLTLKDVDEYERTIASLDKEEAIYSISYDNPGIQSFMTKYSEALDEEEGSPGAKYIEQLYRGEDIEIEASYDEVTRNDPKTCVVKPENLLFRESCDSYEDLAVTKLIVEKKEYNYYDLKKLESEEYFYDIDKILEDDDDDKKEDAKKDPKTEVYEILECTFFTDPDDPANENPEDHVKCKFYIHEEKKIMVGSQYFGLDEIPCDYVPFKLVDEGEGLLAGPGIAGDLTTEDISNTMILRFIIEGWYYKNTITPITDNQTIINDFLEKKWTHGMTLEAKPNQVDFLGNHITPPDARGALELMAQTRKIAEDKIGVTSGMSGGADPVDPNAPATKTLALLSESRPDLLNYIENIAPSLNQCGYIILAMYAQLADETIPYRVKPSRVSPGAETIKMIKKADLQAKTNIQTQAYAFAVDEVMLKKELLAFWQLIRMEPQFASDPVQVNNLLRAIGKAWTPQIRNKIDQILPTIEIIEAKSAQAAMNGVAKYAEMIIQKAKMTGQKPPINPVELIQVVAEHVKDVATPPNKEETERREQRDARIVTGQPTA